MTMKFIVAAADPEATRQAFVADLDRRIAQAQDAARYRTLTTPASSEATLIVLQDLRRFWMNVTIVEPPRTTMASPERLAQLKEAFPI